MTRESKKILFLSAARPGMTKSHAGTFVRSRLDIIAQNYSIEPFTALPAESKSLLLLRKLINKPALSHQQSIKYDNYIWRFVYYSQNSIQRLYGKINPLYSINKQKEILDSVLDLRQYDLIHSHYALPYGYLSYLFFEQYGIPYILTSHGSDVHTKPFINKKLRNLSLVALEHATKNIFVSNTMLDKAKSFGFSGRNTYVIPNGVDVEKFTILDRNRIKDELGFTKPVVGFVGNLIPVKRVDRFPLLFSLIAEICGPIEFCIVGDGKLKNSLTKELNQLGIKTLMTGAVKPEKVPYFMNAMDIIILPSRNEGWPCVVLESHACGIPLVGSSNGGIPEAVGNDFFIVEEGLNFERRFALKVKNVFELNQDRESLRSRALEFSWQKTVQREMDLYTQIKR